MQRPDSRRVLKAAAALALAGVIAFAAPLLWNARNERLEQAQARRLAEGLSPCGADLRSMFEPIDKRLGVGTSTLFLRMSLYSHPRALSLQANGVVEVPLPLRRNAKEVLQLEVGEPRPLSALSPALAEQIALQVVEDVGSARARQENQLDGMTYYFRSRDGRCAMTHSPDAGTRAAAWTALTADLLEHAEAASPDARRSSMEARLERAMEVLDE